MHPRTRTGARDAIRSGGEAATTGAQKLLRRKFAHVECRRGGASRPFVRAPPAPIAQPDSEGDMTPRRSRGRRLVLAAAAASCPRPRRLLRGQEQRAELAPAQGPAGRRRSTTSSCPILIIAIVVGISSSSRRSTGDQVPPPPGQEREPEAGPRQHAARDRLDDRPRADPRDHRGAERRHDLQARREPRARARCRSRSTASSGGGSSTIPTPRSSPPTS